MRILELCREEEIVESYKIEICEEEIWSRGDTDFDQGYTSGEGDGTSSDMEFEVEEDPRYKISGNFCSETESKSFQWNVGILVS